MNGTQEEVPAPARTPYVPRTRAYCRRTQPVPLPSASRTEVAGRIEIRLARHPADQPLSLTRSDMEIASQAEYAGSIPVIGSTLNCDNAVRSVRIPHRCHDVVTSRLKVSPAAFNAWSCECA